MKEAKKEMKTVFLKSETGDSSRSLLFAPLPRDSCGREGREWVGGGAMGRLRV